MTVVEAGPCVVTQIKTQDTDGYEAVQLGFGEVKRRNKPMTGHFMNSRLSRYVKEVKADDIGEFQVGQSLTVDVFRAGEFVDVIGRSKGRGFSGVMKRHGFHGGPRTHGQSDRARAPGSIGGGTTPGKVFKGMKMPGHMGNRRITVKGIEVIHVDAERNLLLLKGCVPGSVNWLLEIHRSVKPSIEPIPLFGQVREAPPAEEPEVPAADGEEQADQQPENQEAENQEAVAEDLESPEAENQEAVAEEPESPEAEVQEMDSEEPEIQHSGDEEQADPEKEEEKPE